MRLILYILFTIIYTTINAQNFSHSGRVFGADNIGIGGVRVQLWKRVTPVITGFTSQTNYNGHSYYRSTTSMTWTSAKVACENMGGHLVTIANSAEQSFVFNTWPSGWIGFNDEAVEGQWRWVTGEPVTYTNWNGGEPNNAGNEDYAQFVTGGRWNDLPNVSLPYVIEFEYIVTMGPWVLEATTLTNFVGDYSFLRPTNPSVEWRIIVDSLTIPSPTAASDNANLILGRRNITGTDYYRYDINNNNSFTVSDIYLQLQRINGRNWSAPTYRLFTQAQHTSIRSTSIDLRLTHPGTNSFMNTAPTNAGITNFYLIRTGYAN
jgi:hypothetical protein